MPVPRRFDRQPPERDPTRINERIRVAEVRLIDEDGSQIGVIKTDDALSMARQSQPLPPRGVDRADPLGFVAGTLVSVTPDDYGKVPVVGELVTLLRDEIAVRRTDSRAGEVVVHFPRVGYCVERNT